MPLTTGKKRIKPEKINPKTEERRSCQVPPGVAGTTASAAWQPSKTFTVTPTSVSTHKKYDGEVCVCAHTFMSKHVTSQIGLDKSYTLCTMCLFCSRCSLVVLKSVWVYDS